MMKQWLTGALSICLIAGPATLAGADESANSSQPIMVAATKKQSKKKKAPPSKKPSARRASRPQDDLDEALALAKKGQYKEASIKLFQLSHSPRYRDRRMQIKYILGLMLYQLKLNQVSAFQFISVVKDGNSKYLKQSLEKLSLAADHLGDDTMLNYAISRVRVEDFPRVHRDMLYYRIGEFQMRNNQLQAAAASFSRVGADSSFYPQAKYQEAYAYSQLKENAKALKAFEELLDSRRGKGVTDSARVSAIMGKARVYYQAKQWDEALENYREIPRDTEAWHSTLFESSWAMMRSGRFRSAISNFQSLHSAYYEDFYLPESLLLRAIVYLYICKYDEMGKVLNLYNRIYQPVYKDVSHYLKTVTDPVTYFNDVSKIEQDYRTKGDEIVHSSYRIPFVVGRKISGEGDYQRSYRYITKLTEELKIIDSMPSTWRNSAIGKYSKRLLQNRLLKARAKAGRQIRAHMIAIKDELFDLMEQEGFIRYEMINGKKEALKKKVAGKDLPDRQIDEDNQRDFYIQNGYEYYPFQGEYWLDELGNYHYVGTQSCE